MNMRQERALETKDKIYASALKLIKEHGYENVFIENITNDAGIAKGSFYTHFTSKENLLAYTFRKMDIIYTEIYQTVKDEKDFFEMLSLFISRVYTELEKLGKELLAAVCINQFTEETRVTFLNEDRGLRTALSHIIEYGKTVGVLNKDIETHFYVVRVITLMVGIENCWCLMDEEIALPTFAEENIRIFAKGLSLL